MALGVCLLFDGRERAIRNLWDRLEERGIPTLRSHTHGRHHPHLSYVVLLGWEVTAVWEVVSALRDRGGFEITFDAVGAFRRGRICLVPAVPVDLVERQQAVLAAVRATGATVHQHYEAGRWLPHCSIAPRARLGQLPAVAAIADQVWPQWRDQVPEAAGYASRYHRLFHVAQHLVVLLRQRQELAAGRAGPALTLAGLHPQVADAALDPWRDGRFGAAVAAAQARLGAMLQAKVGRPERPGAALLAGAFSLDPPEPGTPRLRLAAAEPADRQGGFAEPAGLYHGVRALGRACFEGIPAVLAARYGPGTEPEADEALYCLATFSLLARWIDAARVVAPDGPPVARSGA